MEGGGALESPSLAEECTQAYFIASGRWGESQLEVSKASLRPESSWAIETGLSGKRRRRKIKIGWGEGEGGEE